MNDLPQGEYPVFQSRGYYMYLSMEDPNPEYMRVLREVTLPLVEDRTLEREDEGW